MCDRVSFVLEQVAEFVTCLAGVGSWCCLVVSGVLGGHCPVDSGRRVECGRARHRREWGLFVAGRRLERLTELGCEVAGVSRHAAAIGEEQARLAAEEGTRALDPATDVDWGMIVEQLADDEATPDVDARQEREEIRVLFEDEADAVAQITTALCAVCEELGTAVEHTAELRQTVENAVGRAYRRAVTKFESRLVNDDELAALFNAETDLELLERVNELQGRLAAIDGALGAQLSQAARDEGFARLSPTLFERLEPTGEAA